MPEEDVSDFRDVFEAINRLCDTMKTSSYEVEDDRIIDMNSRVTLQETEFTYNEYRNVLRDENGPDIVETQPCMKVSDLECTLMTSGIDAALPETTLITSEIDAAMAESTLITEIDASMAESNLIRSEIDAAMAESTLITSEVDAAMDVSGYDTNQLVSECDSSTLVASENDSTMIASAIDTSMLASDIFSSMLASQNNNIAQETIDTAESIQTVEYRNIESTIEEIAIQKLQEAPERWSDAMSHISLQDTLTSDTNTAQCEAGSEVYYTASSEVSLLSDSELPEKAHDDGKEGYVIAGHVAAMRERFESMTRTNTPCPDLVRSSSPSLEMFRNTSPSPDRLA